MDEARLKELIRGANSIRGEVAELAKELLRLRDAHKTLGILVRRAGANDETLVPRCGIVDVEAILGNFKLIPKAWQIPPDVHDGTNALTALQTMIDEAGGSIEEARRDPGVTVGRWKLVPRVPMVPKKDEAAEFARDMKAVLRRVVVAAEDVLDALGDAYEGKLKVFKDVVEERHRQDAKWGGPNHDDEHDPRVWVAVIVEHLGRAVRDDTRPRSDRTRYRQGMVRVAALAVAAIESHDRKVEGRSEQ